MATQGRLEQARTEHFGLMQGEQYPTLLKRDSMRLEIIGLVTVAPAMAIDVQMASAINYDSFFQERYCSRRANGRYNCAFKTLEQCKFAIEEIPDRFCIENPW